MGSFEGLFDSLILTSASLPTLVQAINEIISAAEFICVRLVVFGLFCMASTNSCVGVDRGGERPRVADG